MAVLLELFRRPGELDLELRDDVLLAAPPRLTGSGCLGLGSGHVSVRPVWIAMAPTNAARQMPAA